MRKYQVLAAIASLPVLLSCLEGCTVGAAAGIVPSPNDDSATTTSDPAFAQDEQGAADANKKAAPSWTFFVYAQGDNVHSPAFLADLESIKAAKLGANVRVVVLADWNASIADASGSKLFRSGTDRFVFGSGGGGGGGANATIVHDDTEQDFDDATFMRKSIAQAFKELPATHHGLVIWSRGASRDAAHILGGDTQNGARPQAAGMTIAAMKSAIRGGATDAGLRADQPFDVLGFDISSAGRIEDAFAMKDLAKVYIANAAVDGHRGWAYEEAFGFLGATPAASGKDFAKAEADAWNARAIANPEAFMFNRAHIAFDASKLQNLANATSSLVQATKILPSSMARLAGAASMATNDASGANRRPDFKRFVDAFATGPNMGIVTTCAQNAADVYSSAVIGTPSQTGFSIALPTANAMNNEWYNAYLASSQEWFAASDWNYLLAAWSTAAQDNNTPFAINAAINDSIEGTGGGSPVNNDAFEAHGTTIEIGSSMAHGARISASLSQKSGAVSYEYGQVVSGKFGGNEGSLSWTKRFATVGATGAAGQRARSIPWATSDGMKSALIGQVKIGATVIDAAVVVGDPSTAAAASSSSSMFIFNPETDHADTFNAAEITKLDPSATFTPALKKIEGDTHTTILGNPIVISSKSGVPMGSVDMGGGTYEVLIAAEDAWGVKSYALTPFVITNK